MTRENSVVRLAMDRAVESSLAAGAHLTPALALQVHHVCRLATGPPPIHISWVLPGGLSERVLHESGAVAVALLKTAEAVTPAIVSQDDVLSALHEIGHLRDPKIQQSSQLQREVSAWQFAANNSLHWDRTCHEAMSRALLAYCNKLTIADLPQSQAIEWLCSAESFRRLEKAIRPDDVAAFELLQFEYLHGSQSCSRGDRCLTPGRRAVAAAIEGFYCRRCARDVEMNQVIAQLRKERGH